MAQEQQEPVQSQDVAPATQAPQDDAHDQHVDATDWKAEARKWEARAKANRSAADELEKLKESTMSESERLRHRLEKLESENEAYRLDRQRAEWSAKVSRETGVPARLLSGDTLEAMQEQAARLKEWGDSLKPKGVSLGNEPKAGSARSQLGEFARSLFSH